MKIKVTSDIDTKKLEKSIRDQAMNAIMNDHYDISCPHCHAVVNVPVGKSECPICRKEIDLRFDFNR